MSTASDSSPSLVHLALPKGRMEDGVLALLRDAGIHVTFGKRGYRPTLSLQGFETKILKPQNIVEMLHLGSRDLGFAGAAASSAIVFVRAGFAGAVFAG